MIKILFVHHAKGWGGAANSLLLLINNLDKTKFDIEVLLLKDSSFSQILNEQNIKYRVVNSFFYKKFYHYFTHSEANYIKPYQILKLLRLSVSWLLSSSIFAKKELSKHKFDIIHLNSSVLVDWLKPASQLGKVVIHIREPFRKGKIDIIHTFLRHQLLKYANRIIAISMDNANRVNIPLKTEIVYNFAEIPRSTFIDSSIKSQKFLYVGGAAEIKGFYTLVDSLKYLNKGVKVLFAGSYPEVTRKKNIVKRILFFFISNEQKKRKAVVKMINHPNTEYIGFTHDIDKYLDEVCCLVSPFTVPHFARPIVEANLHQKPAIGTNVEGMDEIIIHQITGLIVPKSNPESLAEAINSLSTDFDKIHQFGEESYSVAMSKFTTNNVRLIENLYINIMDVD